MEGNAKREKEFKKVIRIDEGRIEEHMDEKVRQSVEETLNALLDAEADALCKAKRYERTDGRQDTRAGHHTRSLHTKAGQVELKVRNCVRCRSRPRSSSATGAAKRPSKKS